MKVIFTENPNVDDPSAKVHSVSNPEVTGKVELS